MSSPRWMRAKWYPVRNDLIGGWSIATVDKTSADIEPSRGEMEIGTFLARAAAEHICDLHNAEVLGQ